jgi:hypothetical protein
MGSARRYAASGTGRPTSPCSAATWTAAITAPGGVWTGTIVVTVDEDHDGPLTNRVQVTTEEGAAGDAVYIVNARKVYLPLVLRGSKGW